MNKVIIVIDIICTILFGISCILNCIDGHMMVAGLNALCTLMWGISAGCYIAIDKNERK